jgi:hypothetical protein
MLLFNKFFYYSLSVQCLNIKSIKEIQKVCLVFQCIIKEHNKYMNIITMIHKMRRKIGCLLLCRKMVHL